jgi:hypothetical protein
VKGEYMMINRIYNGETYESGNISDPVMSAPPCEVGVRADIFIRLMNHAFNFLASRNSQAPDIYMSSLRNELIGIMGIEEYKQRLDDFNAENE